jgi:nitrate reductase NapE component
MKSTFKKKFLKKFQVILVWFCVWSLSSVALLGVNLSHAKAAGPTNSIVEFKSISGKGIESKLDPLIQVSLSSDISGNMTVDYTVSGTASEGADYTLPAVKTLQIAKNATEVDLPLQIINDNVIEFDETVEVTLSNPSPSEEVILGDDIVFTYTIIDNDQITTTLNTDILPNANGWYKNIPQITLNTTTIHIPATIFYQWNSEDLSSWKTYTVAFPALEGENTLYYYAVDSVNNTEIPRKSEIFKVDTLLPVMGEVTATLISENQVQLSWDAVLSADHYEVYRGGMPPVVVKTNGYLDSNMATGQNYVYKVIAFDAAGNQSLEQTANIFVPEPVVTTVTVNQETEPPVIKPVISYGVSTYKPSIITPEVKAAEAPVVTDTNNGNKEESTGSNWNKLLLAISILIIAAGAAVGGYYGYQWWTMQKNGDDKPKEDKTNPKNRW